MNCKLLFALCAIICVVGSLEAASVRSLATDNNANVVEQKLDYEGVQANVRSARQAYTEDNSGEDSDEGDEEDDAEIEHQNAIRRQQAYEQTDNDSLEGSDEDDAEDDGEQDGDDYYGRRIRRDVSEAVSNNEIEENSKPSENKDKQPSEEISSASETSTVTPAAATTGSSNTSVLILIRDVIKKVTELPNTQQVATSAQQYFQLFEHFLQQTIEQVIGDDDDDEETESTTIAHVIEKENESESNDKISENGDKTPKRETSDKESSAEHEVPQPEKKPEGVNEIKA